MNDIPMSRKPVALAAYMAVLLLLTLFCGCTKLPRDAKLKEMFYGNRDDFHRLVQMSEQDSRVVRIDFDFTIMDTDSGPQRNVGLSEERWQEYRLLFRKLELKGGIERPKDFPSAIFFYAHCEGSAIDADCKGFAYSERPLLPVANNLDEPRRGNTFEPLLQNWYLLRWVT